MTYRTFLPLLLAALVVPASARAATFSDPVTLADWSASTGYFTATDGQVAWSQNDGLHLLGGGAIGDGAVTSTPVVTRTADGTTVAGWSESDGPHFWAGGTDAVPAGALQQTRAIAVTPALAAWIGVAGDGSKQVQIAPRSGTTFGPVQTLPSLGTTSYGLVAAGDASGRSLLVWHASDKNRRIQFTTVAADGHVTGSGWLTPPGEDNVNPTVAMAPDGSGVVAWTHGLPTGHIQGRAIGADGGFGQLEDLETDNGSSTATAAVGRDGTAIVAWRGTAGKVVAARRLPGAEAFGRPEILGGENPETVAASVTSTGDALVAWTDLALGADRDKDGMTRATAAAPRAAFDPPVTIAAGGGHRFVTAGGDRIVWDETRSSAAGAGQRIRTVTLVKGSTDGGGPSRPAADRTAPKLKLRVLGLRKRVLRVRVTSSEAATARLTVRRGARRARSPHVVLRAGKPRVLRIKVPRGTKKLRLEVRAVDAAGNARVLRRSATVPLRPRG
jgi:hypothetical protein